MEFEVRQTKMQSVGSNLTDIKSTLTKLRGNINEVSSNLNRSDRAMASIQQNLKSLASGLEKTATRVGSLSSGITQAATWYTKYEKEICGAKADITAVAITSTAGTTASGGDEEKKNSFEWTSKNWWDLIKNAGFLGSTVSTIRGAITGDGSAKSWTSILKSLTKTIGTGASLVKTKSSGGNWSQYLWGVNNALSGLTTTSWGKTFLSSMKKQFTNDLTWGTGATAADKVKVATKWGGHALTLASDAFDNYDEYKNSNGTMSAGRAVAETVIETGVDIGLGAAATAGVSAAAVALGVTAAPAIVIGGVATVAVWGANSLCKWATGGKNIAETVSDAVCDVGEKAYALGKSAVNAVSEKWNSVTSWAKNAFAF